MRFWNENKTYFGGVIIGGFFHYFSRWTKVPHKKWIKHEILWLRADKIKEKCFEIFKIKFLFKQNDANPVNTVQYQILKTEEKVFALGWKDCVRWAVEWRKKNFAGSKCVASDSERRIISEIWNNKRLFAVRIFLWPVCAIMSVALAHLTLDPVVSFYNFRVSQLSNHKQEQREAMSTKTTKTHCFIYITPPIGPASDKITNAKIEQTISAPSCFHFTPFGSHSVHNSFSDDSHPLPTV